MQEEYKFDETYFQNAGEPTSWGFNYVALTIDGILNKKLKTDS